MEVITTKSTNNKTKFDALVDGNKYHLVKMEQVISPYIKILNEKSDI